MEKRIYSKILGTGSYLPNRVITNDDIEKMGVETSDEWIFTRTGIRERHFCTENDTTTSMAKIACERAMEMAGVSADEIDLIVCGTCSPDRSFPSVACHLQAQLGVPTGTPAFDISAACSGFIYALSIADKFVRKGESKKALVIGAEAISRMIDWTDRSTCILFGDGAGAVVIGVSNEPGIYSTHLHSAGEHADLLYAPHPLVPHQGEKAKIYMEGNTIFKFAVTNLGAIVDETLAANNMTREDVDFLVPHQANYRIIETMAKKLDLPMDRVVVTIDKHGNTSAASIPLALDVAVRENRVKRGEILLLEAFGGGLTWGSALLKF